MKLKRARFFGAEVSLLCRNAFEISNFSFGPKGSDLSIKLVGGTLKRILILVREESDVPSEFLIKVDITSLRRIHIFERFPRLNQILIQAIVV